MTKRKVEKLKAASQKRQAMEKMAALSDNELAEQIKTANDSMLRTKEWTALKEQVHAKYGYRCMCCGWMPKNPKQVNVDHIKSRKWFPELAYTFENLQVLCGRCNREKANATFTDYRPV